MISFAIKFSKLHSLEILKFTMDRSENVKCLFTSLQYVESSHAPYQRIRFFSFTAPGGDGYMYYSNEIWTVSKMTIFRKRQLFKKNIRSNDLSGNLPFFEKSFRSNELWVKWPFGQMTIFRKSFQSNKLSVKWIFGQTTLYTIYFRLNDIFCRK
jgi:hypothetical protein